MGNGVIWHSVLLWHLLEAWYSQRMKLSRMIDWIANNFCKELLILLFEI